MSYPCGFGSGYDMPGKALIDSYSLQCSCGCVGPRLERDKVGEESTSL